MQKQNSKQAQQGGTQWAVMLPELRRHMETCLCLFTSNTLMVFTGPNLVRSAGKHRSCFWLNSINTNTVANESSQCYLFCSIVTDARMPLCNMSKKKILKIYTDVRLNKSFTISYLFSSYIPLIHYIVLNKNWHWYIFSVTLMNILQYVSVSFFFLPME